MFGDMVDTFSDVVVGVMSEVNPGDIVGREEDVPESVNGGGSNGDWMSAEGLSHTIGPAVYRDHALCLDLTYHIVWCILYGRQPLRERSSAKSVAAGGCGVAQGFMRPLSVVNEAPSIEGILAVRQVSEGTSLAAPRR